MFEMMDPYDEAAVWRSFVPPVPPPDADLVDADLVDADELDGWSGAEGSGGGVGYDGCGVLPDPELDAVAVQALSELEQELEAARVDGLDADGILAEAAGARRAERRVQAKLVTLAARWADQHAVLQRPWVTTKGGERLVRLGGDGTPEVAEFAPAELGAVLGMTDNAARSLMADALDLRHRFPILWQQVQAGEVDVWIARRTVQEARSLSSAAAARVDQKIAGITGSLTWRRLKGIVAAAVLAADPPKAVDDAEQAAAGAGVFLDPEPKDGYQGLFINARAGDVQALNEAIQLIGDALTTLGHPGPANQRRAEAAGVIADPQTALDLIARAEAVRQAQSEAAAARRAGDHQAAEQIESTLPDGTSCDGRSGNRRPFAFSTAVLYYHLSSQALDRILTGEPFAGVGVVRVEDIGPVILDQVKQWLGHANVVLKPVINLPGVQPVDHYETPPAISEAIGLIRSPDSWPFGTCTSRHQDNEHTEPFVPMNRGGPPGQTDPLKMSRMTRGHHRIKTHAGWTVNQLRPGAWLYRSPHAYYFLVDQHGTTPLGTLE